MSESASTSAKKRPEFRNINAFTDLPSYRLPAAGWVSILHRVSGALMFALMPFIIWMFDASISSEISFARFTSAFNVGMLGLPGFLWKLVALALIWAFLHHFMAGFRPLWMDYSPKASGLQLGQTQAKTVCVSSLHRPWGLGPHVLGPI